MTEKQTYISILLDIDFGVTIIQSSIISCIFMLEFVSRNFMIGNDSTENNSKGKNSLKARLKMATVYKNDVIDTIVYELLGS